MKKHVLTFAVAILSLVIIVIGLVLYPFLGDTVIAENVAIEEAKSASGKGGIGEGPDCSYTLRKRSLVYTVTGVTDDVKVSIDAQHTECVKCSRAYIKDGTLTVKLYGMGIGTCPVTVTLTAKDELRSPVYVLNSILSCDEHKNITIEGIDAVNRDGASKLSVDGKLDLLFTEFNDYIFRIKVLGDRLPTGVTVENYIPAFYSEGESVEDFISVSDVGIELGNGAYSVVGYSDGSADLIFAFENGDKLKIGVEISNGKLTAKNFALN